MNYYSVTFKNQIIKIPSKEKLIEVTKIKNDLLYYLEDKVICSDLNLFLIEKDNDILLDNFEMISNRNMFLLEIPNYTAISGFSNVLDG